MNVNVRLPENGQLIAVLSVNTIDLDRFDDLGVANFRAKPTRFVGCNPGAPRYKVTVTVLLFSFQFFLHKM